MSPQSDPAMADLSRHLKAAVPAVKAIPGELRAIAQALQGLQAAVEQANRQRTIFFREVAAVLSQAKGDGDDEVPQ